MPDQDKTELDEYESKDPPCDLPEEYGYTILDDEGSD